MKSRSRRAAVILVLLPLLGLLCFVKENSSFPSQLNRFLQASSEEGKAEERPTIYTFFELRKDRNGNPDKNNRIYHEDLISAWKELWYEAGWSPQILTLDDARRHPDYEKYTNLLTKGTENVFEDSYDFMCFMRWLAMSSHGKGGFMADYDTFPLEITPSMGSSSMPNYGVFTSYQRHVPSLISGSASEWERMSHRVLDMAVEQIERQLQEGGRNANGEQADEAFYSDMLALQDLHDREETSYIQEELVGSYPYKSYLQIDCTLTQNKLAVHLAHSATEYVVEHKLVDVPEHKNEKSRHYFARTLIRRWRDQCKSSPPEEAVSVEKVVGGDEQQQQQQQTEELQQELVPDNVIGTENEEQQQQPEEQQQPELDTEVMAENEEQQQQEPTPTAEEDTHAVAEDIVESEPAETVIDEVVTIAEQRRWLR